MNPAARASEASRLGDCEKRFDLEAIAMSPTRHTQQRSIRAVRVGRRDGVYFVNLRNNALTLW